MGLSIIEKISDPEQGVLWVRSDASGCRAQREELSAVRPTDYAREELGKMGQTVSGHRETKMLFLHPKTLKLITDISNPKYTKDDVSLLPVCRVTFALQDKGSAHLHRATERLRNR